MLYIFPFYILINHENFFKYSFQSIDNILFSFFMEDIIDYIKCDQVKPLLTRRISPIITSTVSSLWQFPSINRWRNPAFLRLEKLLTVYYVFHKLMPRTFNGVIASFVKRVRGQKRPYLPRSSFTSRFVKNLIFFYFFFFPSQFFDNLFTGIYAFVSIWYVRRVSFSANWILFRGIVGFISVFETRVQQMLTKRDGITVKDSKFGAMWREENDFEKKFHFFSKLYSIKLLSVLWVLIFTYKVNWFEYAAILDLCVIYHWKC